jgi:hypothetical protein
MNYQIEDHIRHLVVITDPHIKDDDRYFVRNEGMRLQQPESYGLENQAP